MILKKIISILLTTALLSSGMTCVKAAEKEVVIHVSVSGSDAASGTIESPLATPEAAKEKARKLKAENPERTIRVVFHEGEYRFETGLKFVKEDSGSENFPIIYEGAAGERVEFKGSKKIDITTLKPISDNAIKARLKPEIANRVGEINLNQFGITAIEKFVANGPHDTANEHVLLSLNGVEQPIAQFPNGNNQFSVWDEIVYAGATGLSSTDGGIISVTDEEISRWNNVGESYLGGYFGYDYRYERIDVESIDTVNKTITFATGTDLGLRNMESRRWKIFNLLEELDSPGEWYIDRNNMMLYFYAPYNVVNAELEVSLLLDAFMNFQGAENIQVRNIEFSQSRGRGIYMGANTKNIVVEDCSFENIQRAAVYLDGTTKGEFEPYYNFLDTASNVTINYCDFYNIGAQAVFVRGGGNRYTLEPSNTYITNNYISNVSQKAKNKAAITLEGGVGVHVEHNVMHNLPFHAINFFGNDHVIKYNDISNACMESTDAAIIYAGRSFVMRGSEIAYNYVYDYRIKGEGLKLDQVPAVYLDDGFCGANIHHNIIREGGIGFLVNKGQDNIMQNNTMVDIDRPLASYTGGFGTAEAYSNQSMIESINEVLKYSIWQERYPEIEKTLQMPAASVRNVLTQNLVNKEMQFEASVEAYNTNKDNTIYDNKDIFVNPDANDYRIKNETEVGKNQPGILSDINFDMNSVGFEDKERITIPTGSFKKVYPANGDDNINSSNVEFKWEEAKGAWRYRLVIAKDAELKDVVVDKISYYNFANIDELESGRTSYYYTVFAQDYDGDEWNSLGVNYRFTTGQYGEVDKYQLENIKAYAEEVLPGMSEGEEAGLYKTGTIEQLKTVLKKADTMLGWTSERDGSQAEVDSVAKIIEDTISEENINSGYVGSEIMVNDLDNWILSKNAEKDWLTTDGNVLTYTNKAGAANATYKNTQFIMGSKNTIFKTQMKFDLSKGWTGIGLRTVVHEEPKNLWLAVNPCYFFAIKKKVIEFQKSPGGIMKEIPNTFIQDGEWHDVEFGVLNTQDRPVIILNIDGQKVLEYHDTYLASKNEEGAFQIYVQPGASFSIKPSEDMSKEFIYDAIMEKEQTSNELIYKINSDKALFGEEIIELSAQIAMMRDNISYLPLRITAEKNGFEVLWNNEGYAELLGKDTAIKIYPNENVYYINDTKLQAKQPIIVENGVMRLSAEDLKELLSLEYKILDDIIAIGENLTGDEELRALAEKLIKKEGGITDEK